MSRIVCIGCGKHQNLAAESQWLTCANCGPREGVLDIQFDLERVQAAWRAAPLAQRTASHWRYHELLPIDTASVPCDWAVGGTPLIDTPRLAAQYGLKSLYFKDEGRNPTASFKDRASSVGVAHARQLGAATVACASTGNAATSLAGHAALAGLPAIIFVPATAPQPKLAQMLVFGAKVMAVEGTYDEAYELCSAACDRWGWYNRNCAINPVLVEGKKTGGLELAEQIAQLRQPPAWVAVSVGDGCTIAGIGKGLIEMRALGIIEHLPRLLGVQAEGVDPVKQAFDRGQLPSGSFAGTLADSIDVAVPRNWHKAVNAVRQTHGTFVSVSDDAILAAMRTAGGQGIYAEPAAAAALAGLERAVNDGIVGGGESAVVMVTGSGLKDTQSAMAAAGEPTRIAPQLDRVYEALGAGSACTTKQERDHS